MLGGFRSLIQVEHVPDHRASRAASIRSPLP
jgi:hypothetical protein